MQLTKWTVDGWRSAHEGTVLIHSSFDQQEIHAPFIHYWGRLKKGMAVEAHVHQDLAELVVVSHGQGVVSVDTEDQNITEGDVVYVPPGARHTFRNESEQDLYLFAVKYDDTAQA